MSLAAVHQDPSVTWAAAAERLAAQNRISSEDSLRLRSFDAFARMIGNVDRHHHNINLFPDDDPTSIEPVRFGLAPAFDQLPMLYAPTSDGQVLERTFVPPTPTAETWDVWERAAAAALTFWRRAGNHNDVSMEMRHVARENLALLTR